jgi:predicted MFS family arabinose efflux permease
LKLPAFRRLAGSYAVNEIGDSLGAIALAVLVYRRTGDPLALTALFVSAKLAPAFIAPMLVAACDQVAPRRALPTLYFLEAAAFAALAALSERAFLFPAILLLALVDGCLALTARALSRAALAATLKPTGLLREGNALVNIAFAIGTAGGPALGGVIVSQVGIGVALLVDAASFALIAVVLATARGLPRGDTAREPRRGRLRVGLAYVRERPFLRTVLAAQALAFVFFTAIVPIEVLYAKEALGAGAQGFGFLLAAWGAGLVLGSLVFAHVHRWPLMGLLACSTGAVGLAYLALAGVESLWLACVISVAGGLGNGIQWVAVVTVVQENVREDMQARVSSLLESIGAAMPAVGFLLGGALTAISGPRLAYAVAGMGVLLVLACAALALRGPVPERVLDAGQ